MLKWGISLEYAGGPSIVTWLLHGGRNRQRKEKQGDGSLRRTWPDLAGFEDGEWM